MKVIKRYIQSEERLLEIISSMPKPEIKVEHNFDVYIPALKIIAKNKDGICEYHYEHSGDLGLEKLKEKITKVFNSVKENI